MTGAAEHTAEAWRRRGRNVWIVGLVALVALLFALAGGQTWEDYWITFRSSRHLIEGLGPVFQPGERVHTYTSPLGMLTPALGLLITGSDEGALWFLRLTSIAALAAAAHLVGRRLGGGAVVGATLCLALLDSKTVQFSTNGMETGLMVFFVALVWHELATPAATRWRALGAGFAGLMWTRPDGMVPAAAMLAGCLLFQFRGMEAGAQRAWRRQILQAALLGGALYLPWFCWAWYFYGSPVPNTIVAKSALLHDGLSFSRLLLAPGHTLAGPTLFDGTFAPTFFRIEDWPAVLVLAWRLLARAAAFAWLVPNVPPAAKAASFATMLGSVFLQQITVFSWYYAPWTLLGGIALGGLAQAVIAPPSRVHRIGRVALMVAALTTLATTLATIQTARVQDRWIEENGRKAIGLWLREQASPGDRVFLEPLGYIGYYSGLKMLDYPGLCAPEVTQLIRAGHRNYDPIIRTLKPDWVVLRPIEIVNHRLQEKGTLQDYNLVRAWDQQAHLDATAMLPGRSSLEYDALFFLFRRKPAGP